jgi:hypothetical protein
MWRGRHALSLAAALAATLASGPLCAQPTSDRATPETDEPDTAGQPPEPQEDPTAGLPGAPIPYSAVEGRSGQVTPRPYSPLPPSALTGVPTHLEQTGAAPDGPPSLRDMAYESRMRASFASAQSFQGPLDGAWTLTDASGAALYAFQLVDKGKGVVEGAWRDLRPTGGAETSGFIDQIQRSEAGLVLRFAPAAGSPTSVATLQGGYGGQWTGDLLEQGSRKSVSLKRKGS